MNWFWWWIRHSLGGGTVQPGRCVLSGVVLTQGLVGGSVDADGWMHGLCAGEGQLAGLMVSCGSEIDGRWHLSEAVLEGVVEVLA